MKRRDFLKSSAVVIAASALAGPEILGSEKILAKRKENIGNKKDKFDLRKIIEQRPLKSEIVKNVLLRWFDANNNLIYPLVISREKYEKVKSGDDFLKKDGKEFFCLPEDMQLWEIIPIIEKADKNIYEKHPEKINENKDKLLSLAKNFKNASLYINKRIDKIKDGRQIAESLAEDFYFYGESLIHGDEAKRGLKFGKFFGKKLSDKETEEIDKWLAGDKLYNSRIKKIKQNKKIRNKEELRNYTLNQFFRTAQKSFDLQKKNFSADKKSDQVLAIVSKKGELIYCPQEPWDTKTPVHDSFQEKINNQLKREIEKPKQEFLNGISSHLGMESLAHEAGFNKLEEIKNDLEERERRGEKLSPIEA